MKFLDALRDHLGLRPVCPCCETWHATERVESVKYLVDEFLCIDVVCHCDSCDAWFAEEIRETRDGLRIDIEEVDPYDHNGSEVDE